MRTRELLKLHWISTHSDVAGNEKADEEAKKAALGSSSLEHYRPTAIKYLCLKQEHLRSLRSQWAARWKASPRYRKIARIDDTSLPMKNYFKSLEGLTRARSSILFQEHVPLNKYLFRIERSNTDKCLACSQLTGREVVESVRHFCF